MNSSPALALALAVTIVVGCATPPRPRRPAPPAEAIGERARALDQSLQKAQQDLRRIPETLRLLRQYQEAPWHEFASPTVESLYQRGVTIGARYTELRSKDLTAASQRLADYMDLLRAGGDPARQEAVLVRILHAREQTLGTEHPDVGAALSDLADVYMARREYGKAEPLYQRALAVVEKSLGREHPNFATATSHLADYYRATGEPSRAMELYERALAVREKTSPPDDSALAAASNNLGVAHDDLGDRTRALSLYERALTLFGAVLAKEATIDIGVERNTATVSSNAGVACWKHDDVGCAVKWLSRAHEINEHTLWIAFSSLTEHQQLVVMLSLVDETHALVALQQGLASSEPEATRLAMSALLQRKGKIAEALTRSMTALHAKLAGELRSPAPGRAMVGVERLSKSQREMVDPSPTIDVGLRNELRAVYRRLAHLHLLGSSESDRQQAELADLEHAERDLQSRIARRLQSASNWELMNRIGMTPRSARGDDDRTPGTDTERAEAARVARQHVAAALHPGRPHVLAEVQQVIPADATLVEFAVYRPFDPRGQGAKARWGPPRYVAYVLRAQGDPTGIDLGDARTIERLVAALRRALSDPHDQTVSQAARALDEQVMRPIRTLLTDVHHILLSPEGALNLVPFGALLDENHRYLVERFQFTYLTTGRELIGTRAKIPARQDAVIVVGPEFGSMTGASLPARGRRNAPVPGSFAALAGRFEALPGTVEEGRAVHALLPGARLLMQSDATESALKQVSGPSILHIATHGFFLDDEMAARVDATGGDPRGLDAHRLRQAGLVRSGLVLAGANQLASADDDGALTALEVTGLDLVGTRLVVLSACETGVGAVHHGEGVYGLRRAFAIAGAETLVMSLWMVEDESTRDLMVGYYRSLQSGAGRGAALRAAQLEMLASGARSHPFFWSAFIASGDWRSL